MKTKKKEGSFYAAKVRLFLNEYNGISLEEFCKAENVSYRKMCHCLGRPSYRREDKSSSPKSPVISSSDSSPSGLLPEMALRPLFIDMDEHSGDVFTPESVVQDCPAVCKAPVNGCYLNGVRLRTSGQTEIIIGKCPVKVLVCLVKEMEGSSC